MNRKIMTDSGSRIAIMKIPLGDIEEYHVTIEKAEINTAHLGKLSRFFQKNGIHICKAVCFGNSKAILEKAEFNYNYPIIVIKNAERSRGRVALESIYIHAIKGASTFKPVMIGQSCHGICYSSKDYDFLSISNIGNFGKETDQFKKEVKEAYEMVGMLLLKFGFKPKNVCRFWNFIADINKNYAAFNDARNAFFAKWNINKYPAATGIGVGMDNLAGGMSFALEALKKKKRSGVAIETVSSDMQCEASFYGPKFSRATCVNFSKSGVKKIYITGTSSVNKHGKTILMRNPEKNIKYVVSCVEHLLLKNKMTLTDIAMSHVYFKNRTMYKEFMKIYRRNKWHFPFNPVFAEICRKNFFFEMECVGINKTSTIDIR